MSLTHSIKFLYSENVAQVRLRSKKKPGIPFHAIPKYNRYWDGTALSRIRKFLRPSKANRLIGTSVYVEDEPHFQHPDYITYLSDGFYSVSSHVLNWSNLAFLVDKNFFLNVIIKEAENTYNSKNMRNYSSIDFCDKWNNCEIESQEIMTSSTGAFKCSSSSCYFKENMEIKMSDNFLRNTLDSGFLMRLISKKKTNKIKISKPYLMGYLKVVE